MPAKAKTVRMKRIALLKKKGEFLRQLVDKFMESEKTSAYLARAILAIVGGGAIIFAGAIAPNLFAAFYKSRKAKKYDKKQVIDSFYYLRKKKMIKIIKDTGGRTIVRTTKYGMETLREFAIKNISIPEPASWDKKWRVVIFDIPERHKTAREALRSKLKTMGFSQLQKSVFAHPFPPEDEVLFIAEYFEVERFVEILTVDKMLYDKDLVNFFQSKLR